MHVPFTVLALSAFGPVEEEPRRLRLVDVGRESLDEAMEALGPRFSVAVQRELCPDGELTLGLKSLRDLRPESIVKNVPYLSSLREAGAFIDEALRTGAGAAELARRLRADWPDLPLDLSVAASKPGGGASKAVDDILSLVAEPDGPRGGAGDGGPLEWRARIDSLTALLLEQVFAGEPFRTYEAAWRGLEALVKQGEVKEGGPVRVRIASVGPEGLESALAALTVELAAELPNLVLVDFPFDSTPRSIELLEKVAVFAETLLAPTACWITPRFFHVDSWSDLGKIPYLKHYLEDASFAKWRKLRETGGAAWLAVTLNRFLSRAPYGGDHRPKTPFFVEKTPPWLSPVWALGAFAAQSAGRFGWPSRFTDYVNVRLTDLAAGKFGGDGVLGVEAGLSEDRIMEFIEAGMTPLIGALNQDTAFMPRDATAAGGSLKYQLFVNRVLGFLFWLKDNLEREVREGDVAANLEAVMGKLWRETGVEPPEDLRIEAGEASGGEAIPLSISLTPSRQILPGGDRLEFSFAW